MSNFISTHRLKPSTRRGFTHSINLKWITTIFFSYFSFHSHINSVLYCDLCIFVIDVFTLYFNVYTHSLLLFIPKLYYSAWTLAFIMHKNTFHIWNLNFQKKLMLRHVIKSVPQNV